MNRASLRVFLVENSAVRQALSGPYQRQAVKRIHASGIFHRPWYEAQVGRTFESDKAAVRDFVEVGRRAGFSPHPLVWPEWYSPGRWDWAWPEPTLQILHPRSVDLGSPLFDQDAYIAAVAQARTWADGPLAHFLAHATDATPVPNSLGLDITLGEIVQRSVSAARTRVDERASHRHAPLEGWDPAPEAELRAALAALPPVSDRPRVSVVMPVRNRPVQVVDAVESLIAQTYPDWELLVVDDGSTDETPDVLRSLAGRDARVRVLVGEQHGVSGARNVGLDSASGDLVAFLDSDNRWAPDFLEVMLGAMRMRGSRFAYSGIRGDQDGDTWFRGAEGGLDEIMHGNFIDLNAIVVTRALLDEAGHFDESQRRMVDWDLVIRLSQFEEPAFVPFIGVLYDDSRDGHARVTTTELRSWREVILAKHLLDWPALVERRRVPGKVSVVIHTFQDWETTLRTVRAVLATSGSREVEVVVVDNGSRLRKFAMLSVALTGDPRVTLVRRPSNDHRALATDLGFASTDGEYVVVLDNDTETLDGWLEPLVNALDEPGVVGVQPLLVAPDGTVDSAGFVFPTLPSGRGLPTHFLRGMPSEDAVRLGSVAVHAVTGAALMMRALEFAALRGFDPLYSNGCEDIDLCLRAGGADARALRVVPTSRVVQFQTPVVGASAPVEANRQVLVDRWRDRLPEGDDDLWASVGLAVAHYTVDPYPTGDDDAEAPVVDLNLPRVPRPVVVRAPGDAPVRWAIKVPVPLRDIDGDSVPARVAQRLAGGLEAGGHLVARDADEAHDRLTSALDDVAVVVRAGEPIATQPGVLAVLWVTDPSTVTATELARFAVVVADAESALRLPRGSAALVVELSDLDTEDGLRECTRRLVEAVEHVRARNGLVAQHG